MAKQRRKSVICSNCGYRFEGIDNYCPNCGQENHSQHAPIRHLFLELIEGFTHFDTKFFATAKALLFHPGLLTKHHIEDRRARYVAPMRLYVFVSFLFFLSLSLFSNNDHSVLSQSSRKNSPDSTKRLQISFFNETITSGTIANTLATRDFVSEATVDSFVEARAAGSGWFSKLLLKQAIKQDLGMITKAEIEHSLMKNIGFALFILMPLFALILKLLYVRKKRLYIDHLVFSLHFHSFGFVALTIGFLLLRLIGTDEWIGLSLIAILVYAALAMKSVYRQGWWLTTGKASILFSLYSVCIIGSLLIAAFISVLMV